MRNQYVIGLDQSTQGTKAILVDSEGEIAAKAFLPHEQIISSEGWVSHDGEEIYRNSVHVIRQLIEDAAINKASVAAIGISNQRETTIAWDKETGKPVEKAAFSSSVVSYKSCSAFMSFPPVLIVFYSGSIVSRAGSGVYFTNCEF